MPPDRLSPWTVTTVRDLPWRDPAEMAGALDRAGVPGAAVLLSDGGPDGRWSYVLAEPDAEVVVGAEDPAPFARLDSLLERVGPGEPIRPENADLDRLPPFTGGVLGLAAYDLGDGRLGEGADAWPALVLRRHTAVLAFDHQRRRVVAVGCGRNARRPFREVERAAAWLDFPSAEPAPWHGAALRPEADPAAYIDAVADVVRRIGEGELYQANIARAWRGALGGGDRPAGLLTRFARSSAAPFAAWVDLGDRQLVSNSPERFLGADAQGGLVARPIKGTAPRDPDPAADAAHAAALAASLKDRAENLMIVDLMRNDLARVAAPGSVTAPTLFALESYANVHHLVSEVRARLARGRTLGDLMAATFPPGSITGAPKVKAMEVIARHEPPRGPWCGSLFLAGGDGSLSASVLIRTLAFSRDGEDWRFRTLAGAGIVADSDPAKELAETQTKIAAIRRALGPDRGGGA